MRITILAIGKAKGAQQALLQDYAKRLTCPFVLKEFEPKPATPAKEAAALLAATPDGAVVIACDEHGQQKTSPAFAAYLDSLRDQGTRDLVFILGGADGLAAEVRARSTFLLSLGQMTWPHQLARVLLVEQIYRAQQISSGHPYHRA